ncbi:hypothetical protein [Conyzicola sp.]|uniref:hypothetical protein n=1 Tax=Conyzicola sp. TaxID=1969404 RepID=UPI003988C3B4
MTDTQEPTRFELVKRARDLRVKLLTDLGRKDEADALPPLVEPATAEPTLIESPTTDHIFIAHDAVSDYMNNLSNQVSQSIQAVSNGIRFVSPLHPEIEPTSRLGGVIDMNALVELAQTDGYWKSVAEAVAHETPVETGDREIRTVSRDGALWLVVPALTDGAGVAFQNKTVFGSTFQIDDDDPDVTYEDVK